MTLITVSTNILLATTGAILVALAVYSEPCLTQIDNVDEVLNSQLTNNNNNIIIMKTLKD